MKVSYREWARSKESACLGRWSLLLGPEHHLKREALARVRAEATAGAGEEPTWETLEGRGLLASDLLNRCHTGALFGGARIVVVQRAERIEREEQETMAKAVGPLPPGVAVVLVTWERAGGGRRRVLRAALQRAIEKEGLAIQFPSLSVRDATAWAVAQAKKLGKRLEPAAARKLAERKVGTGLGELLSEVEKLALYVGELDIITGAHVEEASPRLLEEDVWRLIDAVGRQQTGRAVGILRGLLREGGDDEARRILGLLAQTIRLIWQTKLLVESGWQPGQEVDEDTARLLPQDDRKNALAQFARRSWLIQRTMGQARAFSWGRLARARHALLSCDLSLKGIQGKVRDSAVALELLVVQLCTDVSMPVWRSPVGER